MLDDKSRDFHKSIYENILAVARAGSINEGAARIAAGVAATVITDVNRIAR